MKVISSELFWIANLLCLKESFRRRKMQLSNLVFPKPVEYNGDLQSERLLDSRSPGPEQYYKERRYRLCLAANPSCGSYAH